MSLTKWQSWWSIHPMIRTFMIISSPLFIPWNITARNPKRYPNGGSNTGGSVQIDRICGFMQPFGLMSVAEFRISPFGPTRCNVTSETRLWFQPIVLNGKSYLKIRLCACIAPNDHSPSPYLICARSISSSPSWTDPPDSRLLVNPLPDNR